VRRVYHTLSLENAYAAGRAWPDSSPVNGAVAVAATQYPHVICQNKPISVCGTANGTRDLER